MRIRPVLLLFLLHALHLGAANAPSEAKADILAGDGTLAGRGIVGVYTLATGADGAEEVVDVKKE